MRTRAFAVPAAAALSLLVAACSPQSSSSAAGPAPSAPATSQSPTSSADPLMAMSADEIAQMAFANLKAASAVHVSGTLADSGTAYDLNLTLGKTTCAGTLAEQGTGSFELLKSGNDVWIKPDDQFWKRVGGSDPSVLSMLKGKYLATTTSDKDFAPLVELCDPARLAGQFGTPTGMVKGQATEVSGEPALQLRDTGDSGTLDVSDSAVPRILRLDAGSGQRLDFSGYGVPASVTAPPASETLSGAKYGF